MTCPTEIKGFFEKYRFLSNFWPVEVVYNNIKFTSVEHAYVAAKTTDVEIQQYVSRIWYARDAKRYGRKILLRPDWKTYRVQVMSDLLIQKFTQQPFERMLLETGNAYLEETNTWGDVFWGVCKGKGRNTLGKLLMKVRTALQIETGYQLPDDLNKPFEIE